MTETSEPLFVCSHCGARSWNEHDAEHGYCGRCHWWTGDPLLGQYTELILAAEPGEPVPIDAS